MLSSPHPPKLNMKLWSFPRIHQLRTFLWTTRFLGVAFLLTVEGCLFGKNVVAGEHSLVDSSCIQSFDYLCIGFVESHKNFHANYICGEECHQCGNIETKFQPNNNGRCTSSCLVVGYSTDRPLELVNCWHIIVIQSDLRT